MQDIQYTLNNSKIIYSSFGDYDLSQTFLCGQAFRFDEYKDGFIGFIEKQLCHITTEGVGDGMTLTVELLTGEPSNELAVKIGEFLSLDMDYTCLKKRFSENEILARAIEYAPGIRVLNQDFFETLITFIISQNNNIPRIKKLCDAISERYGSRVGDSFAFPTAEQLKDVTEQELRDMKFGFRAGYLVDAIGKVNRGEIDEVTVKALSCEDARKYLMTIKGVGPKVADCVLLFSCRQYRSFPKDVWIKKAMAALFPDGIPREAEGYEGIAQQYIFHYVRTAGIIE